MKIKLSLEAQIFIIAISFMLLGIGLYSLVFSFIESSGLALFFTLTVSIPLCFFLIRAYTQPINRLLTALKDGFYNFLDNDFSVSLADLRHDELGELIKVYNKVSNALRSERVYLYQRELLLDTVIQSTPLALVLTDSNNIVIYSNNAARQLFNQGKAINGSPMFDLLDNLPKPFLQAIESGLNGLFTINQDDKNETYHLTQNQFLLNGQKNRLLLIKQLTKEINRQEVNTWKKVIRLISHELNNSLAPISSLAHSGQILSERENLPNIQKIFETVEERARYLQHFIEGYAKFSRLPLPQKQTVNIQEFLNNVIQIISAELIIESEISEVTFDPAQLQQVIINLLKNAHESGSPEKDIQLIANINKGVFELKILDKGKGMSDKNLLNALMPFYSTKSGGTGLGLPLCREIIEAHGGKILINNRPDGGLKVTLMLPIN